MDELLPFVGTLRAVAGAGSLDPSPREDVPLETVALCQNASAGAPETGRREADGDPNRNEPEELLADIQNAGDAERDDKRVVDQAGIAVAQGNVGVVPLSADTSGLFALVDCGLIVRNRPVRNRMRGGVAGDRAEANHLRPPLCRLGPFMNNFFM